MAAVEELATGALQEQARKHLWMHFTRMGAFDDDHEIPIIVRGDGCYVYDQHGRRYLDGLSALYCVNIGHGRAEVAQAGADQAKELGFFTNWGYAHPKAIELATRIAGLAPGDLNRVFFTSGGSESVDSALKLCRQYHKLTGNPGRYKVISRKLAYHGTTMGALTATGIPDARRPFEPLFPGSAHVANTNPYRPEVDDPAEAIRERIEFEGPETVSCVILEPVQNSGGCFGPPPGYFQKVREICDEYGILFISDEVICSWGRLGEYFGAEKFGYEPDLITTAKGLTSSYARDGRGDRLRQACSSRSPRARSRSCTGSRSAGTRCPRRSRSPTSTCSSRRTCSGTSARNEGAFGAMLDSLRDIPIVGDVRGMGYFWAIELVKDRATKETFSEDECEWLLRGFLSPEIFKRGLICRADDRGDPVILPRPAADRRARAVRGDPERAAARPSRRPRGGSTSASERGAPCSCSVT